MIKMAKNACVCLLLITNISANTPQLSIIIVIDQLAYRNLQKVRRYLKGGLNFMLREGINYTQAHTPLSYPETGPAHTTLNTGVTPHLHGIINNAWHVHDQTKKIRSAQDDDLEHAAVFGSQHLQPYACSAKHIMVDGLSDQLCLQTEQHKQYSVYAISWKDRSAICTANKKGKAIWFDRHTGMMTSSKAYFNELPAWLKIFNQKQNIAQLSYTWTLRHKCLAQAYDFKNVHNYSGTQLQQSLIGKTIKGSTDKFKEFSMTPAANQLVFDAALACIDAYFCKDNPDQKMLLWVLPSGLDKLGHAAGPDSIEVIDMIYHLDYQLKMFIDAVNAKTRKRNILWCLTSDHGIAPTPEQMRQDGYTSAYRIDTAKLKQELNDLITQTFDIPQPIISAFHGNSVYVHEELLKSLDQKTRKEIKKIIIKHLEAQPGIKKVWTFKQLCMLPAQPHSIEQYYKNQLFKGRSGKFIIWTQPYCLLSHYPQGTDHLNPYDYNTHVPMIIYQRAYYQRKTIEEPVYTTQFAPTIAHILGVPRPSACTAPVLPGIIFKEDCCF